jgi:hypothetical protein
VDGPPGISSDVDINLAASENLVTSDQEPAGDSYADDADFDAYSSADFAGNSDDESVSAHPTPSCVQAEASISRPVVDTASGSDINTASGSGTTDVGGGWRDRTVVGEATSTWSSQPEL